MAVPHFWLLVLWVAAVAYASDDVASYMFPAETELVYSFRGDVSTGTTTPASFISHFAVQGNLTVQSQGERVLFKLDDVTFSSYNGRASRQKVPAGEFSWLPVPEEASAINVPFAATFVNGKVTQLEVSRSEPLWSSNLKRAITAQFQLDLGQISRTTPLSFVSSEGGISGECSGVDNLVLKGIKPTQSKLRNLILERSKPTHLKLRKSINAKSCNEPTFWLENLSVLPCKREQPSVVSSSTERTYSLIRENPALLSIQNIRSRGLVTLQPFGELGELHYHLTNQTLELLKKTSPIVKIIEMPTDLLVTSLTFELPKVNPESNTDPDLTLGRQNYQSSDLVKYSLKVLGEIADKLDEKVEEVTPDPASQHEVNLPRIFSLLRIVDQKKLRQLADIVLLGTSYKDETVRSLFLEVLPRVGTRAALLVIRDLVTENKVSTKDTFKVLMMLPFNLRHPDQQLLTDFKVLLDLGKDADPVVKRIATLTFASLVGKVCEKGACQSAVLDEYIKYFFSKFRDSTEYSDQLLYMQAMSNIQVRPVFDYLEPIITGKLKYPHHLRVLASWNTMGVMTSQPEKVSQIYWPLLGDRRQHLEIRISALTMLMISQPTPERFMSLLWFMVGEPNVHLYNFFYTSVQSLVDIKHPCYVAMSSAAAKIFRLMTPPSEFVITRNQIVDLVEPSLNVGVLYQYLMVADQDTGLLNVLYMSTQQHAIEYTSNAYAIYLKLEGVTHALTSKTIPYDDAMKTLVKMLSSIKVSPRSPKPIHIEIILQIQGRTIVSHYFNRSSLASIPNVLQTLQGLSQDYHSNYQTLEQLASIESVRPSDLGIPIVLELNANMLISIRGNVTQSKKDIDTKDFTLDTRTLVQTRSGIRTFNFMSGFWQGIHKIEIQHLVVPLRGSIGVDVSSKSLKFRQDWTPGLPIISSTKHTKTQTFIVGRGSRDILDKTCPECPSWAVVSSDIPRNVTLIDSSGVELELFDCEKKHPLEDKMKLLRTVLSEEGKNVRSEPDHYLSFGLLQAHLMEQMAPLVGSCGVKFSLVPRGEASSIEWVLRSEKGANEKTLVRSLVTMRSPAEVTVKSWDTNLVAETASENSFSLKMRVTRVAKGQTTRMMCMKMESRHPDVSDSWDALSATSRGHIDLSMFLEFGDSVDGKCPNNGSRLIMSGTSNELLPSDELSWPLVQCLEEKGSKKRFPATSACAMAAKKITQPRSFSFNITHSNMPEPMKKATSRLTSFMHVFVPDVVPESLPESFTLDLVTVGDDDIKVRVTTDQGPGQFSNAELMDDIDNVFNIKAWNSPALKMEKSKECVVAGDRLLTFDNTSIAFSPGPQFTLMAAECTIALTFAVFVKSVEGTDMLAVKVFFPGEVIDIDPLQRDRKVTINGQIPNTDTAIVKVTESPGKVTLHSSILDIWVRHSISHVTVTVQPRAFAGLMCGLCGDGNGEPDLTFLGPDGETLAPGKLSQMYTVPAA